MNSIEIRKEILGGSIRLELKLGENGLSRIKLLEGIAYIETLSFTEEGNISFLYVRFTNHHGGQRVYHNEETSQGL